MLHCSPRGLLLWHLQTEALLSAWGKSASQCRSSNMTRISSTNGEKLLHLREPKISQTQFCKTDADRRDLISSHYQCRTEGTSAINRLHLFWTFIRGRGDCATSCTFTPRRLLNTSLWGIWTGDRPINWSILFQILLILCYLSFSQSFSMFFAIKTTEMSLNMSNYPYQSTSKICFVHSVNWNPWWRITEELKWVSEIFSQLPKHSFNKKKCQTFAFGSKSHL